MITHMTRFARTLYVAITWRPEVSFGGTHGGVALAARVWCAGRPVAAGVASDREWRLHWTHALLPLAISFP